MTGSAFDLLFEIFFARATGGLSDALVVCARAAVGPSAPTGSARTDRQAMKATHRTVRFTSGLSALDSSTAQACHASAAPLTDVSWLQRLEQEVCYRNLCEGLLKSHPGQQDHVRRRRASARTDLPDDVAPALSSSRACSTAAADITQPPVHPSQFKAKRTIRTREQLVAAKATVMSPRLQEVVAESHFEAVFIWGKRDDAG